MSLKMSSTKSQAKGSNHGSSHDSNAGPYHKHRVRRGVRADRVDPQDLSRYELAFFCDDCGHYDRTRMKCTMGYAAIHTKAEQLAQYDLTGTMAFCRLSEID